MTEPPRPPGDGNAGTPSDPTAPLSSGGDPASAFPPPPPYDPTGPGAGAGGYPPPAYGGYPQQPTSGASGYPSPGSGAGAYPPPGSGAGGYPPGGGAPPPYGYDQAPGFGSAGPGAPGYGTHQPTSDDRTWALLTHFGGAAAMFFSGGWLGWVPPLIALVAKGNQSPLVRAHAVAALNFQLLWSVVAVVITIISTCLTVLIVGFIMYGLLVIPWLVGTICGVIAGMKAANGEPYRYPASPNWVK